MIDVSIAVTYYIRTLWFTTTLVHDDDDDNENDNEDNEEDGDVQNAGFIK